MTIHADDVVLAIRAALKAGGEIAATQSKVTVHPNPEQGWPNRDGRLTFECVNRDWNRGFRLTVEAIPLPDVGGDDWYDTDIWRVVADGVEPSGMERTP